MMRTHHYYIALLVLAFLVLAVPGISYAQTDPIQAINKILTNHPILKETSPKSPKYEEIQKDYDDWLNKQYVQLKSFSDYREALIEFRHASWTAEASMKEAENNANFYKGINQNKYMELHEEFLVKKKIYDTNSGFLKKSQTKLFGNMQRLIQSGSVEAKAAVANFIQSTIIRLMVMEAEKDLRYVDPWIDGLHADSFNLLKKLARDDQQPIVRRTAIIALGKIYPNPQEAGKIFRTFLDPDNAKLGKVDRIAAATSVRNIINAFNIPRSKRESRVLKLNLSWKDDLFQKSFPIDEDELKEYLDTFPLDEGEVLFPIEFKSNYSTVYFIFPIARNSITELANTSANLDYVSRLLAESLSESATFLSNDKLSPVNNVLFPVPPIDKMVELQTKFSWSAKLQSEFGKLAPVAKLLTHSDPDVRLDIWQTFQNVANARFKYRTYIESLPHPDNIELKLYPEKQKVYREKYINARERLKSLTTGGSPLREALIDAQELLAKNLNSPNVQIRRSAANFLEIVADSADVVVKPLTRSLRDPDPFVRMAAARTLGKITPADGDYTSVLTGLSGLLSDRDIDVRIMAAQGIGRVVDRLEEDENEKERDYRIRKAQNITIPPLIAASQRGDKTPRMVLLAVIADVGVNRDQAKQTVIGLTRSLSDKDVDIRRRTARVLGSFGPTGRDAIPALQRALKDSEQQVREAASTALLSITSDQVKSE